MKETLIITPVTSAVNYSGSAQKNNVSNARYVLCGNTISKTNTNATRFVVVASSTGTIKGTFMLGANDTRIIEKEPSDTVYGGTGPTGSGGSGTGGANTVFTKVTINGIG